MRAAASIAACVLLAGSAMADQPATDQSKFLPMQQFVPQSETPAELKPRVDLSPEFLAFCVGMIDAADAEFSDDQTRLFARSSLDRAYQKMDKAGADALLEQRKQGYDLAASHHALVATGGNIGNAVLQKERLKQTIAMSQKSESCSLSLGILHESAARALK